jgi:SAM-dependent methyltransferase
MTQPANFDPIARPYRWLEYLTFGPALQRCRTHFLLQLTPCRSALVLGDGDGRFLATLLAANPALQADAVDTSRSMLHLLTQRAANFAPRLTTHHTSALAFAPTRTYDLVATHFFLDCLTQPDIETLCARILPHLQPGARWVVSDFRIPTGPMRRPASVLVRALYLAFRVLTGLRTTRLPDHAAALTAAGFTRTAQQLSLAGLLITEIWEYTPAMQLPPQRPKTPTVPDPVPDPEPASPSLPEPDPGVFHREPPPPAPTPPAGSK